MRNKITKNWGLKLVSLLFALVIWLVVTNINDPVVSLRVSDVPVTIKNGDLITERGQVYNVLDNTDMIDTVTIYAPRSIIDTLDKSNVVATADMNDLTSVDTIAIKLSTNKYNDKLESIRGNIDSVRLNIEDSQTKSMPIRANVLCEVREGYILGDVSTEQNLIIISGTKSIVSQIVKAQAEVDVSGFTGDIDTDMDIRLYDEEDNEIPATNLERSITRVRVNVEILEMKTVPISYTVSGAPADGYRTTGESESNRNNVVIAGRSAVVQKIDMIEIPEGIVDVTGASENVVTLVDLKDYLPEGTILAEEEFSGLISITVYVDKEVSRLVTKAVSDIRINGVPRGFDAEITDPEGYCSITFLGLASELDEINLNTLEVSVDVAAWLESEGTEELESGYYRIPVSVSIPEDSALVWEELEVEVHIMEAE